MSVAEALALALALALVWTLVSGAGWLISRWRPDEDARRYVTIARLEDALTKQQERHDSAMLAMDRRLAAAVARQDTLEHALDEEQERRRADHVWMSEMQRRMEAWMTYARQLADIIRRELKTEPPPEPVEPVTTAPARRRADNGPATLARQIAVRFSLEEIDELAFELGMAGTLTGETLDGRASSLVMAATRREVVPRLVELCREKRPEGGF